MRALLFFAVIFCFLVAVNAWKTKSKRCTQTIYKARLHTKTVTTTSVTGAKHTRTVTPSPTLKTLETTTTATTTSTPPDLVDTIISTIDTTVDTTTTTTDYATATVTETVTTTPTVYDLSTTTVMALAKVKSTDAPSVNFHHKKCKKKFHYKDVFTTTTKTVFVARGHTSTTLAPSTTSTTDTVTKTGTFTKPQETTTTTTTTTSTDSATIISTITSTTSTVTVTETVVASQTVHAYTFCDPVNWGGFNGLLVGAGQHIELPNTGDCCTNCFSKPNCVGFAGGENFCFLVISNTDQCGSYVDLDTGPAGVGGVGPCGGGII